MHPDKQPATLSRKSPFTPSHIGGHRPLVTEGRTLVRCFRQGGQRFFTSYLHVLSCVAHQTRVSDYSLHARFTGRSTHSLFQHYADLYAGPISSKCSIQLPYGIARAQSSSRCASRLRPQAVRLWRHFSIRCPWPRECLRVSNLSL